MAKHPRKKQRLDKNEPLGSKATLERLLDEESKDDEERKLESMLFGVPYVPSTNKNNKKKNKELNLELNFGGGGGGGEEDGGRPMANLLDSDLFFVDAPQVIQEENENESQSDSDQSESDSQPSYASDDSDSDSEEVTSRIPTTTKKSAWTDPSESITNSISLLSGPSRLRKLRISQTEDQISEKDYESRLRVQFERINPEPTWAKKARKKVKGTGIAGGQGASDGEEEDDGGGDEKEGEGKGERLQGLLTSTTGILKTSHSNQRHKSKKIILPQGTLSIERLRDVNLSTQNTNSGEVKVLTFHPNPKIPILCVATADRRVRLYNVDGHTSPLLQTLHIPSLPQTSTTSTLFHPSGNSILLSGPRPFFFTHDLQTGITTRYDRGLWGGNSMFNLDSNTSCLTKRRSTRGSGGNGNGRGGEGNGIDIVHMTSFSNDGDMLAVAAGKGSQIHLLDWKSGAGQVIGTLKCGGSGGGGGSVKGIYWFDSPSSLSNNSGSVLTGGEGRILGEGSGSGLGGYGSTLTKKHLAVLTSDSEVYIWDVGERKCVNRWIDHGGFRNSARVLGAFNPSQSSSSTSSYSSYSSSSQKSWMAIGSSSGYVNLYDSSAFSTTSSITGSTTMEMGIGGGERGKPKVVKEIANLNTPVDVVRFNRDGQVMCVASKEKKDSLRLIHLPSMTSFSNWPTSKTPLGHVSAVDFSAGNEYLAIGNTRGRVLLYCLREYASGI